MSSETTELTFVRCPSCRSLVPATATRCRICNNPIDGVNKSDESDASKAASRIRQKTISASADEVANALGQGVVENSTGSTAQSTPDALVADPLSAKDDSDLDFDPLGAYLQELEDAEELNESSIKEDFLKSSKKDLLDDLDDDFDPFGLDIFDEPEPTPAKPEPAKETPAPTPLEVAQPSPEALPTPQEPPAPKQSIGAAKELPEMRRPFGMHSQAPRSGAARESMRSERPNGDARSHDNRPKDDRNQDQRRAKEQQQQPQQQRSNSAHNQQQQFKREGKGESRQEPHKNNRGGQDPRGTAPIQARQPERSPNGTLRFGKANPGRLFGWFVSYENPDGRAIELREGRFFVTASSIKATDLVIEDASISTPHALMSISCDAGLKVQDLMSERGLFVRSSQEEEFRREDGIVELEHGDWVRFGDVELQLAVVPASWKR